MENINETKQQSFLYATLILGIATVLVKILGAVFRIPLQWLIGDDGMGFYSTAYDIYLPIYSLAMAGLPVAVSRIVAEQVSCQHYRNVRRTLAVVKKVFMITGIVGLVLMYIISLIVTYCFTGNIRALPAMFVIAPSILFCCIMSAYRGYYEGIRNMFPTAISSVIEAVCKLILGYGFAFIIIKLYGKSPDALSYAAAGAMMGITLGTVLGAVYLIIRYKSRGDGITKDMLCASPRPMQPMTIFKMLIAIAIPVALGSLVTQVSGLIDVTMIQWQLKRTVSASPETFLSMQADYAKEAASNVSVAFEGWVANRLYGCYKGSAYTLFNLIPTITSVIGVSAIPVLTMVWSNGNRREIKNNINSIVKLITLIAFPAGIGMMALAPQIISLLYNSSELETTSSLLRILGAAACFAGMSTPLTNMLQAIGKQNVPVKNIGVGAIIKIISNLTLVSIPGINIRGAAIGTLLCYIYIALADLFCLIKYSKVLPDLFSTIIKPLIASALCGIAAYVSNAVCGMVINSAKISTVLAILVALVVYVISISLFKCISEEDMLTIPKGEKIVKLLKKMYIIR